MSVRNKFLIMLAIILAMASVYYFLSTPGGRRNAGEAGRFDRVARSIGTGSGGACGGGDDWQFAVAGERQRIHAAIDERVDVGRRTEFTGEVAIGAGATGAGGSDVDAGGKRQPPDDWSGTSGSGIRSGPGAGGD